MSKEVRSDSVEQGADQGVPVCHGCFTPIDPSTNYCAKCGSAVGQHTEYVPFVNIAWLASGYDRLRRSTWSTNGSVFAGVISMFATLLLAPILLYGMLFKWLAERLRARQQ
jgi:hypothetical protein